MKYFKTKNRIRPQIYWSGVFVIFWMINTNLLLAQSQQEISVSLSFPEKPGRLIIDQSFGSVKVRGYEGKILIIKAIPRPEKKGKIGGSASRKYFQRDLIIGLEEYENTVSFNGPSEDIIVDFEILVPKRFSLKLDLLNDGDIYVEGVIGELDVSNNNGKIDLVDVGGTIIADALNKNITVQFNEVIFEAPMVFTSMNGDIDLSFPNNLKARFKAFTEYGDLYSDIKLMPASKPGIKEPSGDGDRIKKYRDKWLYGVINGGGPEIKIDSFNGNIYLKTSN